MARRSMGVAAIKEILVQWSAGEHICRIAPNLGSTRPTVRKYSRAAQAVGLALGSRQSEAEWERLACAASTAVTPARAPGAATTAVAHYHAYLERHGGQVRLSVL
jgi:predicted transcriptional regulator